MSGLQQLSLEDQLTNLREQRLAAHVEVHTLGQFSVTRLDEVVPDKAWGRDKAIQLFQFLLTIRHRHGMHKEQIIDRIWEDIDTKSGDQIFKVALHGINKALEPDRKNRSAPRFIKRQGLSYQLSLDDVWLDIDALEQFVALGNQALTTNPTITEAAYREAIALYQGTFLPSRIYEDWSSDERERLQVLILGTYITLGELILERSPLESIRLAQQALLIDQSWEDAYRLSMAAYQQNGNRPMVIKTYRHCVDVLEEEFGIPPLPETRKLYEAVMAK